MSLPQSVATLIAGIGVGLTVAAPVGPMGILCIQRTLTSGAAAGLATGLGAATVHLAYSVLAIAGIGAIIQRWAETNSLVLGLVSGIVLLWFAVRMRQQPIALPATHQVDRTGLIRTYTSAIGLGVANPLTIILFCAALHTLMGHSAGLLLAAGVFIGSVLWWTILSATIAIIRLRFDTSVLGLSNKLASLLLMGLGALALAKACGRLVT
ncbi:putative lysine exporter protein (LYSE/YGGA) [Bradyrhizobium sp. ORS 285]|uniref:LysE family translocator n=1 Tax=Bradyrhizobium sp. ORS 285 TaxID=115808 RepID=UPI0002409580|nr:LysE family transporter [Bradyrhizobium sp. ORS 285]CCD89253.1 putative lysine exporter protein (LYSE/YGGA) [Bradyrhizobium sp. ORS 285]SMX56120.1 putative lysine exporter protein (LYSE/YGGA) [Bradyrhizobium sp. ORS 285]